MSTSLRHGWARVHTATRARGGLLAAAALVAALAWAAPAQASEGEPWWHVDVAAAPTNLTPHGEGVIDVIATNVGDAPAEGASHQITVSDKLPPTTQIDAVEMTGKLTRESFYGAHTTTSQEAAETKMSGDCKEPTGHTIEQEELERKEFAEKLAAKQNKGEALTCTFNHTVAPFQTLLVKIRLKVEGTEEKPLENEGTVTGGGAAAAAFDERPLTISGAPVPFEVSRFEMTPEEEGGGGSSLAGGHPFQLTNTLGFKLTREEFEPGKPLPSLPALPRNLSFKLPPGLLGNPTAVERCTEAEFAAIKNFENRCPASSAIGVAVAHFTEPHGLGEQVFSVPVFDIAPAFGEPARFGFFVAHTLVYIDTAVNSEEEYAATAKVTNASQAAEVLSTVVTLWGDPGSKVHDDVRGWECVEGEEEGENEFLKNGGEKGHFTHCPTLEEEHVTRSQTPFLIFPTTCRGALHTTLEGVSWPAPGAPNGVPIAPREASLVEELEGCGALEFSPELKDAASEPASSGVKPDTEAGSTPSGLTVDVHVPQAGTLSASGRATSAVKSTTVTLPQGMLLNPGAANALLVCTPAEVGVHPGFEGVAEVTTNEGFTAALPECVNEEGPTSKAEAKVGTVSIKTPLLDHEIHGAVYLGSQGTNPFQPPLVLYLIVNDEADGIRVKLAGTTTPDPLTGQLTSTFKNTPQLPFEDLKLHFFGEGRASLSTPGLCGAYTTTSSFTPWSGGAVANPSANFQITSGPNGLSCAGPLPFAPGIQAGATGTTQAAAFTSFSVTVTRPDGEQAINGLNVTLPPGVAGVLANVAQCPEAQAEEGTCGEASLIGHATTVSGLGSDPFTLHGGNVYLTTGYQGAPFGLSIVFPNIVAGPFHIGTVVVRSSIFVNETTAQVTIKSAVPTFVETVPHVRKGVPVQLKQTSVETFGTLPDGKGFQFNPTNCSELTFLAGFTGEEGGASLATAPMHTTGCDKLSFNPGFEAEAEGQGSKPNGTGFKVITTSQGIGVANIHRVHVALPIQLPSRLSTIQQACLAKVFNESPSKCPEGSNVGFAHIETPVLKNPLSGPAYLVSHGSEEFPDLEFVLQGEGIKLLLDGKTDIKKGVTYSTFESTPDAPFTRFETYFPPGPHSIVTANVPESKHFNLCGETLLMPTEITSQSGTLIKETTHVKVTGCPPKVTVTKAKLSGRSVVLSLNLSAAGAVTVTGTGLKKLKKSLSAGTHQVKVTLSKAGLAARKHRKKITIHVSLKVGKATTTASKPLKL